MNTEQLLTALRTGTNLDQAIEYINTLTNDQRLTIRALCESQGISSLPRNLYYNYNTQQWL